MDFCHLTRHQSMQVLPGSGLMKFTRDWLFDHLETDRPLDTILEALPMLGLEVESVVDRGKILAPFVIAEVVSAVQHPNADKLRLCKVNIGTSDPVQVVCGAPNARSGMKGGLCSSWFLRARY